MNQIQSIRQKQEFGEIMIIVILSLSALTVGFIGINGIIYEIIQNEVENIINEFFSKDDKLKSKEFTVNTIPKSIPVIQPIIITEPSVHTGDSANIFDGATITVTRNNGVVQEEKIVKDMQVERSWQIPNGAKLFTILQN